MKKILLALSCVCFFAAAFAQDTLHVLFIGNSYTAVNNLPQTIKSMAAADGKVLDFSVSAPGGATLEQHCTNSATQSLIQQGGWDYVVLQEQSQIPAFPESQVDAQFYPYAERLDSLIHVYSPCAQTVFYVTWGRKYGDQQNGQFFPPIGTYEGMDSMLTLRYTNIADSVGAYLSPVGPLWHYLRDSFPSIELYQSDNSHPSQAGTFAAACAFYSVLFGVDVQNNTYGYTLSSATASVIRNAAQQIVSDSLQYWYRFNPPVSASFELDSISPDWQTAGFSNLSQNATGYLWNFGDGETSTAENPVHTFPAEGFYYVCLTAYKACDTVQYCDSINLNPEGINENEIAEQIKIYPNPANDILHLENIQPDTRYALYDVTGRKIQSGRIKNNKIAVSRLQSGFYFIKFILPNNETGYLKFQKK